MTDTLKKAGAACPKCYAAFCAEHKQLGQPARWNCNFCGASGLITGELSISKSASAAAPAKSAPPPWARNLIKG